MHTLSSEEQGVARKILGSEGFDAALKQSKNNTAVGVVLRSFNKILAQPALTQAAQQNLSPASQAQLKQSTAEATPIVPPLPPSGQSTQLLREPTAQETIQRSETFLAENPKTAAIINAQAGSASMSLAVQEKRAKAQQRRDLQQAKQQLFKELRGVNVSPALRASVRSAQTFDDLLDVISTIDAGLSLQSVTPAKLALAAGRGDHEATRALTLLSPGKQHTTIAELSKAATAGDQEAQRAVEILKDLRQSKSQGKRITVTPENETIATLRRLHFSLKTGGPDAIEAAVAQLQKLGFDEDRARNIASLLGDTPLARGGRLYKMIAEGIAEQPKGQSPTGEQPALTPTPGGGVAGQGQFPEESGWVTPPSGSGIKGYRRVR